MGAAAMGNCEGSNLEGGATTVGSDVVVDVAVEVVADVSVAVEVAIAVGATGTSLASFDAIWGVVSTVCCWLSATFLIMGLNRERGRFHLNGSRIRNVKTKTKRIPAVSILFL